MHIPDHVENEGAYRDAIDRRIKANARTGRERRWLAEDPTRHDLCRALRAHGGDIVPEHIQAIRDRQVELDWDGDLSASDQKTIRDWQNRYVSPFLIKMSESLREWGSLTATQEKAVREALAKGETIKAEREAKRAERAATDAGSQYIGTVGKRDTFLLTVRFVTSIETTFGTMHVHTFDDGRGNVVVYKGSSLLGHEIEGKFEALHRGEVVGIKATVKAHSEYQGVKQTVLSRPKLVTAA